MRAEEDIIVCDLGRTTVRLVVNPSERLLNDKVIEWPVHEFEDSRTPIVDIFKKLFQKRALLSGSTRVAMCVPAPVLHDQVRFFDRSHSWDFSIEALKADLQLGGLSVTNDMVALGYAAPLYRVTGKYQLIGHGVATHGAPILMIGIRSGVGTLCMLLTPELDGREPIWFPLQSEGGHLDLVPQNSVEAHYLDAIASILNLGRCPTASDVLSATGTMKLYSFIAQQNQVKVDYALESAELSRRAKQNLPDSAAAAETIKLWCQFLGSYIKNLALAFGAHGGVYISGPLPVSILGGDQFENQRILRERIESGGPGGTYLSRIPTALVTHPDPYLLGLGRIYL